MRDRIFSNVDLPAPLRPTIPAISPRPDLEIDVTSSASYFHGPATGKGLTRSHVTNRARQIAGLARDRIAKRRVTLMLGLVSDQITFAQTPDAG